MYTNFIKNCTPSVLDMPSNLSLEFTHAGMVRSIRQCNQITSVAAAASQGVSDDMTPLLMVWVRSTLPSGRIKCRFRRSSRSQVARSYFRISACGTTQMIEIVIFRNQSQRIGPVYRVIYITVRIYASNQTDWVFSDIPACVRIIVSIEIVKQAGLNIFVLP